MSSTIIPCLGYRDAPRMIGWLCDTFGFKRHAVYEDDKGGIAHAELTLGAGMIMCGSEGSGSEEFGRLQKTPAVLGGTTQSPYVAVADADEVYGRAKRNGAEIVIEIKDESYGGRGFSCRDPEGHLWNIGTYDPWKVKS
ncbi:MAG: VOC family protein [Beijerinckiaceae bacterium]|nr:VOC family protein [Beijerinckiaceae bacterium]MCI0736014.1 VOC family protein [Beijerinckiaceae bacterium]